MGRSSSSIPLVIVKKKEEGGRKVRSPVGAPPKEISERGEKKEGATVPSFRTSACTAGWRRMSKGKRRFEREKGEKEKSTELGSLSRCLEARLSGRARGRKKKKRRKRGKGKEGGGKKSEAFSVFGTESTGKSR